MAQQDNTTRYVGMMFWWWRNWFAVLCGVEGIDADSRPGIKPHTIDMIVRSVDVAWYFVTPQFIKRIVAVETFV